MDILENNAEGKDVLGQVLGLQEKLLNIKSDTTTTSMHVEVDFHRPCVMGWTRPKGPLLEASGFCHTHPRHGALETSSKQARVAAGKAANQGPGGPYKRSSRGEQ